MNTKTPIRVVKRNAKAQSESAPVEQPESKKTAQQAARDVVATVSGWVNEFQQKRRAETSQALKTLFTDVTPQASKA